MSDLNARVAEALRRGHEAAPPRLWTDPRIHQIEAFTPAAVLIALTEREEPGVLLLHRPSNMRAHPGQVAFPGGRIDPGESAIDAALREAHEELGIDPALVSVVGTTDTYRTGSAYEITPVLATIPADITITPNPTEVAQWFEAPARFVLNPANQITRTLQFEDRQHSFIEIVWHDGRQDHVIWGVTGAILHNLAGRLGWHGVQHG